MFTVRRVLPVAGRLHAAALSRPVAMTMLQARGVHNAQLQSLVAGTWAQPCDTFPRRHIGPSEDEAAEMLKVVGVATKEELVAKTVPTSIALKKAVNIAPARSESEVLSLMRDLASKNKVYRSFIGCGYYGTNLPAVIQRNILENPGWYTQYTPYQAEVAQGRLESLVNFQTMVADLTGLKHSNASLLDEATAGAEAVLLCCATQSKKTRFFVDEKLHPQTIALIRTRTEPLGINITVGDYKKFDFSGKNIAGVIFQYPNTDGSIEDFEQLIKNAKTNDAMVVCATDLLALTLLKSPGQLGCDVAVGSAQRFGVPLGYGGPHAGFIACVEKVVRRLPGRLCGVSVDANGKAAYRLTLQTRETHIRREKATSNICTAQALLANIAAMYAIYHGPKGLKDIATRVHGLTGVLAKAIQSKGHTVENKTFFDTLTVRVGSNLGADYVINKALNEYKINLRRVDDNRVGVSLDEATTAADVRDLISSFTVDGPACSNEEVASLLKTPVNQIAGSAFERKTDYLTHPIFNTFQSETELMRYCKSLENKDVSLVHSMIPLGSCTMKLNSATEMMGIAFPQFNNLHPFIPMDQAKGYHEMFDEIKRDLCEVTGYDEISLQPNSGANGEYAGLLAIRGYHKSRGEGHRNICLIPVSAHGTNPASAAMAGMKIVPINVLKGGEIDFEHLKKMCEEHSKNLAAIMITYPSTFGIFDENVGDVCDIVHKHGGQVFLDGANMNAQVMLCRPGDIGSDVSHLNLHKTFCIPHGGGGPGMGPIGVKKHLAPFLPHHPLVPVARDHKTGGAVSAAPFGSSLITTIPWAYIKLMGSDGLRQASTFALLNANYMAKRLENHYNVLFRGAKGFVAHEFVIDLKPFKAAANVDAVDIAKRLQDYGFHSPTMSWPVPNSLMIEPTESESKAELDRYVDALICIREEIKEIEDGKYPKDNNVLKNSPHPLQTVVSAKWDKPYSVEKAAFPLPYLRARKTWPGCARVNDTHGDLNLQCSCPPMDSYTS